jgi:hypothetical protein
LLTRRQYGVSPNDESYPLCVVLVAGVPTCIVGTYFSVVVVVVSNTHLSNMASLVVMMMLHIARQR